MRLVFDANALIAYLKDEIGADVTDELLRDQRNTCYVHALNLCEVYYDVRRRGGEETAQAALAILGKTGLEAREDMDREIWQNAGRIKADHGRVSLADCFCMALSNKLRAEVVTSDRHELEAMAKAGVCRIRFIR